MLRRKVLDRGDKLDAGVVDQDVEPAENPLGVGHQPRRLTHPAQIGVMRMHLHAGLPGQGRAQLLDLGGRPEPVQHHVRALASQRPGQAEPDAAG